MEYVDVGRTGLIGLVVDLITGTRSRRRAG
jgi:hypothetical protein